MKVVYVYAIAAKNGYINEQMNERTNKQRSERVKNRNTPDCPSFSSTVNFGSKFSGFIA